MYYHQKAQKLAVLLDVNFYNKNFNDIMNNLILNDRESLHELIEVYAAYSNIDYARALNKIVHWNEEDMKILRQKIRMDQGY